MWIEQKNQNDKRFLGFLVSLKDILFIHICKEFYYMQNAVFSEGGSHAGEHEVVLCPGGDALGVDHLHN